MIELQRVRKTFRVKNQRRLVLNDITHTFKPGLSTGILGRNGAGKTTLLNIIGGKVPADSGRVIRTSRLSWPIGFSGCFHGHLTGRENLRFVCRIYGASIEKVTDFVADFSELGPYMDIPVNTYSSGMSAKLAFGLSMALEFDFYLVDEVTAVGDASFRAKAKKIFNERRGRATLLVVSHNIQTIKAYCQEALVLDQGELRTFPDMNQAIKHYQEVCQTPAIFQMTGAAPAGKA
ncbi:MAG: ABC transporter ATP-binding protein [Deltaproteobacteria bacterium]|nr:ABC transporter ATP-binding protein [Deltaproteobacteria bacterium]